MASVYLKRSTWYARFKDHAGAWRSQATKAANKTEPKRLALDLERLAERQRFGLEPLPSESTLTLGELCEWWLDERCPEPSRAGEGNRLSLHVLRTPLAALPIPQVTAAALDGRLRVSPTCRRFHPATTLSAWARSERAGRAVQLPRCR
jgi:hypothetical protein